MAVVRTSRAQFDKNLLRRAMSVKIDLHKNEDGTYTAKSVADVGGQEISVTAATEQAAVGEFKQTVLDKFLNRNLETFKQNNSE
jgi:hypothetical protein